MDGLDRYIARDPAADVEPPPEMHALVIESEGAAMNGNVLVAGGPGPHPTALVLHGFPGNENNFDLAHTLRRAGWNAVVFHYRGSWGSEGRFSFGNVLEDAGAALRHLREPDVAAAHRIDPERVVLIGHSMGGFVALELAARDSGVRAAASISGFDFGAQTRALEQEPLATAALTEAFREALPPLHGATAEGLVDEFTARGGTWALTRLGPPLADRPVLLLAGRRDQVAPPALHHEPLAAALRDSGVAVTEAVLDTDHGFSDRRIELARRVLAWLETLDRTRP